MRNPFKKTLSQRAKKFATTHHPLLNNLAVLVVLLPALKPVGQFIADAVGTVIGGIVGIVTARTTGDGDNAAKFRKAANS